MAQMQKQQQEGGEPPGAAPEPDDGDGADGVRRGPPVERPAT
jgi:hypothetical protein